MRLVLLIFILMGLNGCTGLLVYELVSSSQFIADNHKDKSHMYPKPKSEFKPKKEK